jgi:hypothetical protein
MDRNEHRSNRGVEKRRLMRFIVDDGLGLAPASPEVRSDGIETSVPSKRRAAERRREVGATGMSANRRHDRPGQPVTGKAYPPRIIREHRRASQMEGFVGAFEHGDVKRMEDESAGEEHEKDSDGG